ncbi:hypothetical protein CKJ84_07955 [Corynebacterium sp. NML 120412]|uniref:hypothetical protein n=1 Tax=Corynebacterium sp. NML 120412 TaxID=2029401 RepID=UPI000BAA6B00|nr:hypothetical protein [Corynebacterium sp. NML 120412]PAT14672.1 hypothetical protein CKJ84_07955 [Corynebacterium sp. NML 120412]
MSSRSARALAIAAAGSVMLALAPDAAASAYDAQLTAAEQAVTDAKTALAEAKQAVQSQQAKVDAAQAALDWKVEARNVAKRKLEALDADAADEQALADATDAVNDANIDAETERVELSVRKQAVEDAREELRRATVALAKAQAAEPEVPASPETPAAGPGNDGSTTAGTTVAVVLGVLAALGAGVALAPRLGIDLSGYGIQLP